MTTNSHSYIENLNNDNIKIYINGEFFEKDNAKISVFDSGFLLGDGVWESFRLHNGHLCFIDDHIDRLINLKVSGVIYVRVAASDKDNLKIIKKLKRKNIPVVLADRGIQDAEIDIVTTYNFEGS